MRGGFGPFGGGAPVEKPMNFRRSVRRLLERLSPDRMRLVAVILLGVTSVAFLVIGPKILGRATDLIFAGAIGKRLPAGLTEAHCTAIAPPPAHPTLSAPSPP